MTRPDPAIPILLILLAAAAPAPADTDLARCLEASALPRVARVADSRGGPPIYVRVLAHDEGVPTTVSPLAPGTDPLSEVLDAAAGTAKAAPAWAIDADARATRICAPLPLGREEIDSERRVVVAAGLNYAAHADEAGGGDVFLFPKPVAPGGPYAPVALPAGVTLFDYEVELAFVLLDEVDLAALPTREALLATSAFFVANDLTDREPIIVHKALSGPGTGFVEAKGQPGFLPSGPWLVRGTELFAALDACGAAGLGLRLDVDEGDGFRSRQDATTAAMILDPLELLARIASEVSQLGLRSEQPVLRGDVVRHYPLAVPGENDTSPRLPAGSVVLTGTPEGVSLQAPGIPGVVARGLLRLRGPFEQFRREQIARAAAGEPGGYLAPGDRVRASIDGLGTQIFSIAAAGAPPAAGACDPQ